MARWWRTVDRMRWILAAIFGVFAAAIVGAGLGTAAPGWHGTDVHLVDGYWVGTERTCRADADDQQCRAILAEALRIIGSEDAARVAAVRLATLPTTFVTVTGEVRTARTSAGIGMRAAVVIDWLDGRRTVLPLGCHAIAAATCERGSLEDWRDGHVPPSFPPGAIFG